MGNRQNTIEVNGNRYDAVTGQLITAAAPAAAAPAARPKAAAQPARKGVNVDGFVRRSPAKSSPQKIASAPVKKPVSTLPSHAVHAKPARSNTLMRHAVKKPAKLSQKSTGVSAGPALQHPSSIGVDPTRLRRAEHAAKSRLVSRFGSFRPGIDKKVEHLPVKPVPLAAHGVSMPIDDVPPITHSDAELPLSTLDLALKNAPNHEEPRLKRMSLRQRAAKKIHVSPRTFNVGAGLLVALVLGGLVAYRYIPQLAVRVAATRAGVQASLPSYKPSGFSLSGPIQYSPGQITLAYDSNSDERGFHVTQKTSDWTSQALLENFITPENHRYQTFQDNGRTVYIYDGSNATWVSGGIWYQIEGESSLTSDQLLRIAESL